jgi:hypothetical protein
VPAPQDSVFHQQTFFSLLTLYRFPTVMPANTASKAPTIDQVANKTVARAKENCCYWAIGRYWRGPE